MARVRVQRSSDMPIHERANSGSYPVIRLEMSSFLEVGCLLAVIRWAE